MDQPSSSKGYLKTMIGDRPTASAAVLAILVLLVIVLSFYLVRYRAKCPKNAKGGYEGMMGGTPSAPAGPCGPGETPVSYQNPDGSTMTYCRSTNVLPGPATVCGAAGTRPRRPRPRPSRRSARSSTRPSPRRSSSGGSTPRTTRTPA